MRSNTATKINSLLIDAESLLKQGYYGAKQIQMKNGSVGTIYHFINTIRRFHTDYSVTKVVVFWEGENSKYYRQAYYPYYKSNRNDKMTLEEIHDLDRQRVRIKQYLEELFIRQVEVDGCEADDAIAVYCKNSNSENKIIYTNDRDLLQLLDDKTKVFLHGKKALVTKDNFKNFFKYDYRNVGLIKMISGDISDNISGLEGIGEDSVLKFFPELLKEVKDYNWISERTEVLLAENPKSKKLQAIKEGKTKWGTYGREYFTIMEKIISLNHPNITEDLNISIAEVVNDVLSPEGRGGINKVIEMMKEDEILIFLPKNQDWYYEFWASFINIINKEKKNYERTKTK